MGSYYGRILLNQIVFYESDNITSDITTGVKICFSHVTKGPVPLPSKCKETKFRLCWSVIMDRSSLSQKSL